MKKKLSAVSKKLAEKRHKIKVKRKDKIYNYDKVSQKISEERKQITKLCRKAGRSKLDKFLYERSFYQELLIDKVIYIPKNFEFKENYESVIKFCKIIYSSLQSDYSEVVISFKHCENITLPSIFIIKAIIKNFQKEHQKYKSGKRGAFIIFPKIKFEQSSKGYINYLLDRKSVV